MFKQHNWNTLHQEIGEEDNNLGWGIKIKIKKPKITIKKVVPKITVNTKTPLKTISHGAADYLKIVNPLNQAKKIADFVPFTKKINNDLDKLSGGLISKVTRVSNLPSKVLDGKPISKQDIMEAVTVALQVAAIVASGGSAAVLISVAAGSLKQGPLGQTSFGRNLLTLAEVGGMAYGAYSAGTAQAASAGAEAGTSVATQATTKTASEAVQKAVQDKATSMVRSEVEKEFEKKTGIPVGIATKLYNVADGSAKIATLPKDIAKHVAEDQLKKAGLGNTVTQAILSNNASQLGVMIKNAPNLALTQAQRQINAEKVKLQKLASIDGLKSKAMKKVEEFKKEATDTDKLREKFEKATDVAIKKELKNQLDKAISSLAGKQKQSASAVSELELESARASVLISSAQEGRYEPSSKAPFIIGGTILAGGLLFYFKDDLMDMVG